MDTRCSGIETMTINYNRDGLEMSREQISTMRNNFHATLNYSKKFVEKHSVAGILGAQLENYNIKNVYARRTDPAKDGLTKWMRERMAFRARVICKDYVWLLTSVV